MGFVEGAEQEADAPAQEMVLLAGQEARPQDGADGAQSASDALSQLSNSAAAADAISRETECRQGCAP